MSKKIIFMGTPSVAEVYLESLLEFKYNVISVFTQPPRKKNRGMQLDVSAIEKLAKKNNIKVHSPDKLDDNSFHLIESYKPDLIIVMAYGLIIPKNILNIPTFGCINIHLSLLPRWRGASPIEYALINDDNETGVSIIKLIEKLDAGPIINIIKTQINENSNKDELMEKLNKIGSKLLVDTLPDLFLKKLKNIKNQNDNEATYSHKINTTMRKINFNNSSKNIFNQIRAYAKKPGAWFVYKKERIKIIQSLKTKTKGRPGVILNEKFAIGCNDGSITPVYLQREGKKIMHIDELLRGFRFKIGDKLNE